MSRNWISYSDERTCEVAIFDGLRIVVPDCIEHFYSNDTVIGWVDQDTLNAIIKTLADDQHITEL